jgi:hypothetical protein
MDDKDLRRILFQAAAMDFETAAGLLAWFALTNRPSGQPLGNLSKLMLSP